MKTAESTESALGSTSEAVRLEDVSFSYGKQAVLSQVSLSVASGEAVALCGANGSGKTTLLKLCAGLLAPASGNIFLRGKAMGRQERQLAFRSVGFLFQDSDDQVFSVSVREDVAYGPKNLGLPEHEVAERVSWAMELVGVSHLADRSVHLLSGGEKKRVALAGVLAMRPPILVLDEPTAGLDPKNIENLLHLLGVLKKDFGLTLVLATHDMDRIPSLCERMVVMSRGRLLADGQVREIISDSELLEQADLRAPAIVRLFSAIGSRIGTQDGIPLTVEEALARYGRELRLLGFEPPCPNSD